MSILYTFQNIGDKTELLISNLELFIEDQLAGSGISLADIGGTQCFVLNVNVGSEQHLPSFDANISVPFVAEPLNSPAVEFQEDNTVTSFTLARKSSPLSNIYIDMTNAPKGEHVDILILDDGNVASNSMLFGSRLQRLNWYNYVNAGSEFEGLQYSYNSNYTDHATSCAGCAAGRANSFAEKANIFSIRYNSFTNRLGINEALVAIKNWHDSKPTNPETGHKNPTVLNCAFLTNSLGHSTPIINNDGYGDFESGPGKRFVASGITYRGQSYDWNLGDPSGAYVFLRELGMKPSFQTISLTNRGSLGFVRPGSSVAPSTDFRFTAALTTSLTYEPSQYEKDSWNALASTSGVFIVASAGNHNTKVVRSGHPDFNNSVNYGPSVPLYYYNRAGYPAQMNEAICVGSLGNSVQNQKAMFSSSGPGVDVYAQGVGVKSFTANGLVEDLSANRPTGARVFDRNPEAGSVSRHIQQFGGTSASAAHIAGAVASYLSSGNYGASLQDVKSWIASSNFGTIDQAYGADQQDSYYSSEGGSGVIFRYPFGVAYGSSEKRDPLNPEYRGNAISFAYGSIDMPENGSSFHKIGRDAPLSSLIESDPLTNLVYDADGIAFVYASGSKCWFNTNQSITFYPQPPNDISLEDELNYLILKTNKNNSGRYSDNNVNILYSLDCEDFLLESHFVDSSSVRNAIDKSFGGFLMDWQDDSNYVAGIVTSNSGVSITFSILHQSGTTTNVLAEQVYPVAYDGRDTKKLIKNLTFGIYENDVARNYYLRGTQDSINDGEEVILISSFPIGDASTPTPSGRPGFLAGGSILSEIGRNPMCLFGNPTLRRN